MIGFYYKIIARKFKFQSANTVFRIIFTLLFLINAMIEIEKGQMIISLITGSIIIILLINKYTSFKQKKFDAILQMLGSSKKQSILHQFLNTSSAAFMSLLILLVFADLAKLINTNFNFLDTSSILSLDNLLLAFGLVLGLNLATSIGVNLFKKDSNFFQILRK